MAFTIGRDNFPAVINFVTTIGDGHAEDCFVVELIFREVLLDTRTRF